MVLIVLESGLIHEFTSSWVFEGTMKYNNRIMPLKSGAAILRHNNLGVECRYSSHIQNELSWFHRWLPCRLVKFIACSA